MRFSSHECRWFFAGALPEDDEIVERFRTAGGWPRAGVVEPPAWPADWRVDRYVCLPRGGDPADADMGIKLRDERALGRPLKLEFKGRTASLGHVELSDGAVGLVEQWVKWSYEGPSVPEALWSAFGSGSGAASSGGDPSSAVTAVHKKRLLRTIRLDPAGDDEEVAAGAAGPVLDRGVGLELTRVRVEGIDAWTLGLEAFPAGDGIDEGLRRVAARFLGDMRGVASLEAERSMSYPAWLARRTT